MKHVRSALAAGLLVAAAACGPSSDLETARAEVVAADSAWQAAAAAAEDLDAIVSYLAEDAVMIPPNEPPVRGREAIRRYIAAGLETPGFSVSWRTLDVTMGPSGDLAYMTHINRFAAENPSGELVTFRGRGVTIWERDGTGEWKCVLDIWNQAEAGGSPAAGLDAS